tara:strand:- start:9096 stop:9956 length:861 start_codon:yes stop_codon:yes gene_type:complete
MTRVLYARPIKESLHLNLKSTVQKLKSNGVTPWLRVALVGDDPASQIYTKNKKKFIEGLGGKCDIVHIEEDITEQSFKAKIKSLSSEKGVHGFLIQLPLPKQLSHLDVGNLIPPSLDVDGLNSLNMGELLKGDMKGNFSCACTPKGIVTLLDYYDIPISGKNICIIGRSLIVGKPLSALLTNRSGTVTLCHSKTENLQYHTSNADIIIVAIGSPKFLKTHHLNPSKNQTIIDVGINKSKEGKLFGDVDFENVKESVAAITPVPGGVGPLTILSLAQNLLQAAEKTL